MNNQAGKMLLVGDNPFHGISHLSQEASRARENMITYPEHAANLVLTSLDNGADGFMFSVSEKTLSIIRTIREMGRAGSLKLYAIVPYAYEYVRLATQIGTPGLMNKFAKQILVSGNLRAIASGLKGVSMTDPMALLKTYLIYEISRIESSAGKQSDLKAVLLHEIVTDMALALDLDWLFKFYVDLVLKLRIKPGFNTRNFAFLARKFMDWGLDFREILIATPFNQVGFQMNPSRKECEKALADIPAPCVIAISILAAGYLKPRDAVGYLAALPNIMGAAVGVSKEQHARETFKFIKENFSRL
jgi:hypothetical protein